MKTVRDSIFETNSSSVHALVVCNKDVFNHFKRGKTCIIFEGWGVDPLYVESNPDNFEHKFEAEESSKGYFVTWDKACEIYKNWVLSQIHIMKENFLRYRLDELGISSLDELTTEVFRKRHGNALINCFSYKNWKNGFSQDTFDKSFLTKNGKTFTLDSWFFLG